MVSRALILGVAFAGALFELLSVILMLVTHGGNAYSADMKFQNASSNASFFDFEARGGLWSFCIDNGPQGEDCAFASVVAGLQATFAVYWLCRLLIIVHSIGLIPIVLTFILSGCLKKKVPAMIALVLTVVQVGAALFYGIFLSVIFTEEIVYEQEILGNNFEFYTGIWKGDPELGFNYFLVWPAFGANILVLILAGVQLFISGKNKDDD
jgi:hypothetical protein